MEIVFIGSSSFGLRCLKEIIDLEECNIAGVITAPEAFNISYSKDKVKNVLHADIPTFCKGNSLPFEVIAKGMNSVELFEKVKAWQPDVFIVVGWYHMIPPKWLNLCEAYGLHASLLPDYSGGAPLVWAIINGEKKTGITLFKINDGVDSGPIIGQSEEIIFDDDTILTLYGRIEEKGISLLKACIPKLASGESHLIFQDESKRRTFPQRSPQDGLINFNWSSHKIYNFIRAQTKPYPGAFLINKNSNQKITVWSSRVYLIDHKIRPGSLFEFKGDWGITSSDGVIIPLIVNFMGKNVDFEPEHYRKI